MSKNDNLCLALYEAVEQNDLAETRRLLAAGATWEPAPKQEPLLHLAANRSYEEIVTLLLEHGYDPNVATEYQTAVKIAALNGDAAMIRLLLARGADPSLKQPLYYALYRDHAEAALALIEGGADLNDPIKVKTAEIPNRAGFNVITRYLLWALSKKMAAVALAMVAHGAQPHPEDLALAAHLGYTKVVTAMLKRGTKSRGALYEAARKGRVRVMRRLVDALGVDLELRVGWDGSPLLHLAARNGWVWLAERWLAAGGAVDAPDNREHTALQVALNYDQWDFAQFLCDHGADMLHTDAIGYTPLHAAAGHGALTLLQAWCAAGGEINSVTHSDETPLSRSLPQHPEVALLLLEHGAEVQARVAREGGKGYTPLHLAAQGGLLDVVRALVAHGADVNARDGQGDTPLILAARAGHTEVLRFLLAHGARNTATLLKQFFTAPSYQNNPGYFDAQGDYLTVAARLVDAMPTEAQREAATRVFQAHLALRLRWIAEGRDKKLEMIDSLVELGVAIDTADDYGFTALHYAAERGDQKCVAALLQHGAAVNVQTPYGYTPLHYAARHKESALTRLLLDAGADPAAALTQGQLSGWTPLHFALSYEHQQVSALLRPVSPPVEAVAPGSHGLRGVYANDKDGFTPTKNTKPITLDARHRCLRCHEKALYRIGHIWQQTGFDQESTVYFLCANCGAPHAWDDQLVRHTGRIPWHRLE